MKQSGNSYEAVASYEERGVSRDADIASHMPLVNRIASHFRSRLPAAIEVQDLIQAGVIGLMECLSNFDPNLGNDFHTYAKLRIRGAMLDEIRRASWAPRSTVKAAIDARNAETHIVNTTGMPATHQQIAAELGLEVNRYHTLRGRNQGLAESAALEEYDFSSELPLPEELVENEIVAVALRKSISSLKLRDKQVLVMYYEEEMTLKEIGAVLLVSESRVSQLLTALANKLRLSMQIASVDNK